LHIKHFTKVQDGALAVAYSAHYVDCCCGI